MRIYLTGYMGCGKTTTGKALAEKLGFQFFDLDKIIEEEAGMSVENIFSGQSEKKFRMLEKTCLYGTEKYQNVVVATGGGTPYFFDNMKWMNQNGITIYLQLSSGVLFHRLVAERKTRPLLKGLQDVELMELIVEHLTLREPFYLKARHVVKADNITAEKLAALINEKA